MPAFAPRSCAPSTVGEEGCEEPGLECRSRRACEGRTDTGSGVAALPPASIAAGGRSPGAPRRAGACGPAVCTDGGGVCMGDSGGRPPPCAPAGAPAVRTGDGGVRTGDGGVSSCTASGLGLRRHAPRLGRLASWCSHAPAALGCKNFASSAAKGSASSAAHENCQQLWDSQRALPNTSRAACTVPHGKGNERHISSMCFQAQALGAREGGDWRHSSNDLVMLRLPGSG